MSHQVENMFSVGEAPWHKLGKLVSEAPNVNEAIKLAGLDWRVEERQMFHYMENSGMNNDFVRVPCHKVLTRSTDNKILGVVGKNYKPLQNDKAFQFFNPFIESGLASFETAGSLREGRTVWILAKLNKTPIEVGKGDIVNKYLLLSNGHDGTMAVRTGFTPIRVVCANTLGYSISDKRSNLIRITHSKKVNDNLDRVREIVNAMDAKFEATAEQYKALSRSDVNQKDLEKYVDIVFKVDHLEIQRRDMARKKYRETIQRLFETGKGHDLKGSKGTMWGLYNSVTNYLSHEYGRDDEKRLNALWFGGNQRLNQQALDAAIKLAV